MLRRYLSILYTYLFFGWFICYQRCFGREAAWLLFTRVPRFFLGSVLKSMGAEVGAQVNFAGELSIDNAIAKPSLSTLHIGENCYIGRQVYFDLPDHIFLAAEVVLSSGVKLLTHQDCGERLLAHYYPRRVAPIRLERGCWIGANAIVLCGVTLGEGCVVGAGAVVTRSFPAYSVLAGVPACVVKTLA